LLSSKASRRKFRTTEKLGTSHSKRVPLGGFRVSWQSLWLRMMGRDLRRTAAYVVPTALAVMLFLLFRSLLDSLGKSIGIEASPFRPESLLDAAFSLVSYLVAFFSGFFAVYFHRLYVQGESQALGLLAMFGLSPRDRRNLIRLESAALGAASFALGVVAAYLLGPLFARFTAVFFDLGTDLAFRVTARALGETGAFFGAVFLTEALYTSFWAVRRWPKELFSAALQAEDVPKPSWKSGILGFTLLFGGYGLAAYVHPWVVASAMYASDSAESTMKWSLIWLLLALAVVVLVLGGSYLVLRDTLRLWVEWRRRRVAEGKQGTTPVALFLLARLGADLRRFSGAITVFASVFAAFFTIVAAMSFMTEFGRLKAIELNPVPLQANFISDQELSRAWGRSAPPLPADVEASPGVEPPSPRSEDRPDLSKAKEIFAEKVTRALSRLAEEGIVVDQRVPYQVARLWVISGATDFTPSEGVSQDKREAVLRTLRDHFRAVEVLPQSAYEALRAARIAHTSPAGPEVELPPQLPPLTGGQAFFLAHGMDAATFSRFLQASGGTGFPFAPGTYELSPGWEDRSTLPDPELDAERGRANRETREDAVSFELVGATGMRGQILDPTFDISRPDATLVVADELWERLPLDALFVRGELTFGEAMWVQKSSLPRLHRLAAEGKLSEFGGSRGFASHGGAAAESSIRNVWFFVQSNAVEDAFLQRRAFLYTLTFLGFLLFTFGALALYLRLREGEARDLAEVRTLRSLGFRAEEVRQIWRREALALYLLPLALAFLHLAFAVVDAGGVLPRASKLFNFALVVLEGARPPSLAESLRLIPPSVVHDLLRLIVGNLFLFVVYAFFTGSAYGEELWRRAAHGRR